MRKYAHPITYSIIDKNHQHAIRSIDSAQCASLFLIKRKPLGLVAVYEKNCPRPIFGICSCEIVGFFLLLFVFSCKLLEFIIVKSSKDKFARLIVCSFYMKQDDEDRNRKDTRSKRRRSFKYNQLKRNECGNSSWKCSF